MRRKRFRDSDEYNPMSVVANLFDVAIVFVVALMVALVTRYGMGEMLTNGDFTMVKNPGKSNMEIITKKGKTISKYKAAPSSTKSSTGGGKRVGTAYQLENGEVVYVPE